MITVQLHNITRVFQVSTYTHVLNCDKKGHLLFSKQNVKKDGPPIYNLADRHGG